MIKFIRRATRTMIESDSKMLNLLGNILRDAFISASCSRIVSFFRFKPYMDDKKYIEREYLAKFGSLPDLENPQTFNEKNNWRKLHDRKDIYTKMVDKYLFKEVVRERCGEGYTFPLLGVWDSPDDIVFDALPEKFALKANHAGGVIVCRNKDQLFFESAKKELKKVLKDDYYYRSREWPYKNVKRKIIAEAYMGENLTDYKNYCFNGKLMYTFVWENESRADGRKPEPYFCGAYDRDWKKTKIEIDYPSKEVSIDQPSCYQEMQEICEKLSKDIPFVRVDCYIINDKVYAGEMTFFPWGGFQKFKDPAWNMYLGEMMTLPTDS